MRAIEEPNVWGNGLREVRGIWMCGSGPRDLGGIRGSRRRADEIWLISARKLLIECPLPSRLM